MNNNYFIYVFHWKSNCNKLHTFNLGISLGWESNSNHNKLHTFLDAFSRLFMPCVGSFVLESFVTRDAFIFALSWYVMNFFVPIQFLSRSTANKAFITNVTSFVTANMTIQATFVFSNKATHLTLTTFDGY